MSLEGSEMDAYARGSVDLAQTLQLLSQGGVLAVPASVGRTA
ncbi:hypothetical protein GA0074692_0978 [Micromonospora pallida]|uniref:Uncharacterized protein n=1 Tax=Micromonospora pallida TaxID=145854 RepID=A0A1C6RU78_9ACTN|nr:hypothetical protein GA0074692_0978 [Micromonospora pallida]